MRGFWTLGCGLMLGVTAAGGASAQDRGRGAQREDSRTCDRFGAGQGSRDHAQCMLAQQRRRDTAPLRAAEQQRLSAEAAQRNLATVRRMRCERDAKQERARGVEARIC